MRSLVKIKPSGNGKTTLSFIDIGKSCLSLELFTFSNMSFNAIRENKILAKISRAESTVSQISIKMGSILVVLYFQLCNISNKMHILAANNIKQLIFNIKKNKTCQGSFLDIN